MLYFPQSCDSPDILPANPVTSYAGLLTSARWEPERKVLRCAVWGDVDMEVANRVRDVIEGPDSWNACCALQFSFWHELDDADIRVGFVRGIGTWAFMGTQARQSRQNPSMNFGWLSRDTSDTEFERCANHEFGHALGLIHEHQSPRLTIPWDFDKVYEHYARTNGWSPAMTYQQIIRRYSEDEVEQFEGDPDSCMCYLINPGLLTAGSPPIGGNRGLSALDQLRVGDWYGWPDQRRVFLSTVLN